MKDSMLPNVLGSASAGIIARTFTHPLDTAKARLQAVYNIQPGSTSIAYRGPVDVLIKTAKTEGLRGLYRGFGAVIVGGTPGTMLYLCSYEIAKERLSQAWESRTEEPLDKGDFVVHFASGMIAETISCIVYVPVDVIKERMQVQHPAGIGGKLAPGAYRSSYDALKQIAKTEGMSGVYKGYAATLGSFGPFSALYFAFYEKFKFWARRRVTGRTDDSARSLEQNVEIPFPYVVLCSAGAGALASWLTSPLDMAKLRLQVQRGNLAKNAQATATYRGVFDCLQQTYREGGLRGLFRGAGARVIHFAPATTITMTSFETCRSFFSKILMPKDS